MVTIPIANCDIFDYDTGNGFLHVEKYSNGTFRMYGALLITASNVGVLTVKLPFSISKWGCTVTPRDNNYPDLIAAATLTSDSIRIDLTKNGRGTPEMDNGVSLIVIGRWK